eukprot:scaffold303264_cov44-Prasinocladus_malaysianus.AAC.1
MRFAWDLLSFSPPASSDSAGLGGWTECVAYCTAGLLTGAGAGFGAGAGAGVGATGLAWATGACCTGGRATGCARL